MFTSRLLFPAVVGKKCRVDFSRSKPGHWPGVEAQRPAGKNQIRRLQGLLRNAVSSASCGAGGKPAAGVTVGKQGRQPVVEGAIPRHDGGHRRLHGFLQIAAGSVGRSFSLPSALRTNTMRAGEQLAEVGPIFIRSQTACSCASLTGLSSSAVVGPGLGKQRLAGRVVYCVVHRVSTATGGIADSPSRKVVLKVSASVTVTGMAAPRWHFHEAGWPGIARLQHAGAGGGTSRSSAALDNQRPGRRWPPHGVKNQPASGPVAASADFSCPENG